MLSVSFIIKAYYTINENNNKEKLFCQSKLTFCRHNYHFACKNWEKGTCRSKESESQGCCFNH